MFSGIATCTLGTLAVPESRHANFGGSVVHSMLLIYAPDGTCVYGPRGGKSEGIGSVCGG